MSTSSMLIGSWFSSFSSSFAVSLQESSWAYLTAGPSVVVLLNRDTATNNGSHELLVTDDKLIVRVCWLNLPVESIPS